MRPQIKKTVGLALDFWETGDAHATGDWDGWVASVGRSEGHKEIFVNFAAPSSEGDLAVGGVTIYPREFVGEPDEDNLFYGSLRHEPEARRKFQELVHCRLFWPVKHAAIWARAQVSVYFLQRAWKRSQEDEAWVWERCISPALRLTKEGRESLTTGTLGFEVQDAIVRNYVAPFQAGGFQSYVRSIAWRAATQDRKRKRADLLTHLDDTESAALNARFRAFVRQRMRRGAPGLWSDGKAIRGAPATWKALHDEWFLQQVQKRVGAIVSSWMVAQGASSESARRQVRRWLKEGTSIERMRDRFREWEVNRRRRRRKP